MDPGNAVGQTDYRPLRTRVGIQFEVLYLLFYQFADLCCTDWHYCSPVNTSTNKLIAQFDQASTQGRINDRIASAYYRAFNLAMGRSSGFGSTPSDSIALFRLGFPPAPLNG